MDGSRHAMHYILESTYGTTPATPNFKTLRHTGTSLGLSKGTMMSEELRSDRQIQDYRHGILAVGGDINTEVSFATLDDLFQAVLCGTWGNGATITAVTLSAAASDSSFNDSGNGFITAGFAPGDFITVSGFTGEVGNNGDYVVATVAAGKITVIKPDGSTAVLVDDAAGESVTIGTKAGASNTLKAGVTRRSFSVLRNFTDMASIDEPFYLYKGVEYNTFEMEITPEGIVTAGFGTIGREQGVATEAPASSTFTAANNNGVMDSFSGQLIEGGTLIAIITAINFTLDNGLEARPVVGSNKTIRPSIKRSNASGTITAYFENSKLVKKFIEETESSIAITIADRAGNKYIISFPRIKYNGGQPDVDDEGPITLEMPFQALRDAGSGSQIIINRIAAA